MNRESREWLNAAVGVASVGLIVWMLFPGVRFWTRAQAYRLSEPWRQHQARLAAQRQMFADVVELVSGGTVPAEWVAA